MQFIRRRSIYSNVLQQVTNADDIGDKSKNSIFYSEQVIKFLGILVQQSRSIYLNTENSVFLFLRLLSWKLNDYQMLKVARRKDKFSFLLN